MATFTQEAKNLVLVTTGVIADTTSNDVGDITVGGLGAIQTNGAGYNIGGSPTAADKIKLALNTGVGPESGSTQNLFLVSEELNTANIVSIGHDTYQAPYEAVSKLTLEASHDYTAGESVVMSVRFKGYGSVSMKNSYVKHGAYYVQSDADTNVQVAAGIVANFNKNAARDRTPLAVASVGGADVAAQIGTTIDLVAGATTQDLTGAGTNASDVAGWATIDGELYYVTGTSGGSDVTLNRPAVSTAAATTPVNTTNEEIIIVGERQSQIDFEHPFEQNEFDVSITKDRGSFGVSQVYVGASKGVGFGPNVRNIESFANQSTQRNQFVNKPRMYDERLQAVASSTYDVLSIKVATTKKGSGSDVTSVREITVYDAANSLVALRDALALIAPNASKNGF